MRFSPVRSSSRTTTILVSCASLALLADDSRALTLRKYSYDAPADLHEARLKAAAHLSLLTGKKGKGEWLFFLPAGRASCRREVACRPAWRDAD